MKRTAFSVVTILLLALAATRMSRSRPRRWGGSFNSNTQAYWEPGELTAPPVVIEAGKTAWVLGMDESGQHYKIVRSCDYLWVSVGSMGANFDEVWQGRPLTTGAVE